MKNLSKIIARIQQVIGLQQFIAIPNGSGLGRDNFEGPEKYFDDLPANAMIPHSNLDHRHIENVVKLSPRCRAFMEDFRTRQQAKLHA